MISTAAIRARENTFKEWYRMRHYKEHLKKPLFTDEKEAIINFSDDVTYRLNNLVKEMVSENNA